MGGADIATRLIEAPSECDFSLGVVKLAVEEKDDNIEDEEGMEHSKVYSDGSGLKFFPWHVLFSSFAHPLKYICGKKVITFNFFTDISVSVNTQYIEYSHNKTQLEL